MFCFNWIARVRIVFFSILVASLVPQAQAASPAGLLALYDFSAGSGGVVRDRSGVGTPLDLRIADTSKIRWLPGGGLQVLKPTRITSSGAATKLSERIKASNAITIEAWIRPASTGQSGPARIVTLSADPYLRNFTLGQASTAYDVRLRTTRNNDNGTKPSVTTPSGTLNTGLTHVVYTRNSAGSAAIYVNGVRQVSKSVSGNLGNWDSAFRFALVNELSGARPWLGTLQRVAIYSRALGGSEIDRNFAAGARPGSAATANNTSAPTTGDSTTATGGTGSTQTGSGTTSSQPAPLTGSAVLSWKPPATRSDGTPLSPAEIAGYVLSYGVTAGKYSNSISINDAYTTSVTVADLPRGTYYFVVTTRDTLGMQSAYSKTATRVID